MINLPVNLTEMFPTTCRSNGQPSRTAINTNCEYYENINYCDAMYDASIILNTVGNMTNDSISTTRPGFMCSGLVDLGAQPPGTVVAERG
jgi:hypothetical protein